MTAKRETKKQRETRISRSENMRRIRSKNTLPETAVRKLLRELGFLGYRINRADLPGKPDVAFIGKKKAIFVHGCFWHGHSCKDGVRKPKSNQDYWLPKIQRNQQRDEDNEAKLSQLGWSTLTIWECHLRDRASVAKAILDFMADR